METSLVKDRKYLTWNNRRGISWFQYRGYHWLKARYLPAVERLQKANCKQNFYLLSDCYYMIGDVYDFIGCPKTAIKAYKRSFEFDPTHGESLRELASMYDRIGQYRKALSAAKKSLEINPEDEFALDEYNNAVYSVDYYSPALYVKTDVCWQAREKLAQEKPKAALRLLENKRTIPARQIKACAYAAMVDTESYIDQWDRIANQKGSIEMTYGDWFYIEDHIYNGSTFWEIMLSCAKQNRFDSGVMPYFESIWNECRQGSGKIDALNESKAQRIRRNKRMALLSQYHISRTNRDLKLAEKLLKRHPNWPELIELKEKLSK